MEAVDETDRFEAERPRLVGIASRVLGDHAEAQDVVQQAWLRLHRTETDIDDLPAWLTTVTTRLCLDRLRSRTPVPVEDLGPGETTDDPAGDPADEVALADTVGLALQVVLERLSPRERVAFVLHDSFGFEFPTIARILDSTPAAARKLASRARAKVAQPRPEDRLADWEVVDAFMAAARNGDFDRLLRLLAPDAGVTADDAAVLVGTPRADRGPRGGGGVLRRQRQGRARRVRRRPPRQRVVPPRHGQGGLRLHRRRRPRPRHHLPRRTRRAGAGRAARRRPTPRPTARPTHSRTRHQEMSMKTMTCRDLGGPCDLEHHGESADEVIKAQDRHLKEAEKAGDATHQAARDDMKGRWRHPKKSMGWYRDTKQAFAALPDD